MNRGHKFGFRFVSVAVLSLVGLCTASANAQQWTGPFGAQHRLDYLTGNVYVGSPNFSNSTILFDVVNNYPSGRDISFHAYAGTPTSGVRTTAIWGETNNPQGRALQGFNFATSGAGVGGWFETASAGGTAIRGRSTSLTGQSYGGWFDNASAEGVGLFAAATAASGSSTALWVHSHSPTQGYGLYVTGGSRSHIEHKVGIGMVPTAGTTAMLTVNGNQSVTGNLSVTGSVSKGGGTFKIDHPLDPANKYLYHSFVESPDMMNVYNGIINTDSDGFATITMPDYFEALNSDFRYQLTIIDESDDTFFAQAKVVKGIAKNQFSIRTSIPNQKVSWQVTGVRIDAWANANRVKVEVEKQGANRGTYLYPELLKMPRNLTEGWSPEQEQVRHFPRQTEAPLVPAFFLNSNLQR